MKECQLCRKHPAAVHWKARVGEKNFSMDLCLACATKMDAVIGDGLQTVAEAILKDLSAEVKSATADSGRKDSLECPACHMRWRDYGQSRRVGCPACYEAFAELFDPFIRVWHKGANRHVVNRRVRTAESEPRLSGEREEALRSRLREAIKAERYEEAARLRDELARLHSSSPLT